MVFQAGWSDHSNSSHSMTQGLHLYPETTVWTVLGMYIATLALFIALGMCPAVSLSMESLQEEIFSISAMCPLLVANQVQQPKLWIIYSLDLIQDLQVCEWTRQRISHIPFTLSSWSLRVTRSSPLCCFFLIMNLLVEGNIVILINEIENEIYKY